MSDSDAKEDDKGFLKLLKAVCTNCKKSSLLVYHQNIKRLYRLIKPDAKNVPTSKSWLNSEELCAAAHEYLGVYYVKTTGFCSGHN